MMTHALDWLAQVPLAIAPRYLGYMLSVLQGRQAALPPRTPMLRGQPIRGTAIVDRIAVVPLVGPIMQRPDLFGAFGAVSVGDVRATIGAAMDDPDIDGVLAVVDSPGGEVAGVADLADALYEARSASNKPILAVADEGIFSAAYWISAALGPIVLPRTGSVGSIGALIVHQDVSKALDQMGVKLTVVKSGAKKALFSPFNPLSEEARAALQTEVDRIAALFIGAVARYRNMDADRIAGFEAGTFEGPAAVTVGLADAVNTVDGAFLALKMHLTDRAATSTHITHAARVRREERNVLMADSLTGPPSGTAPVAAPGNPSALSLPAAPVVAAPPKAPETVDGPAVPTTPWSRATNVVNIAEAREQAAREATAAANARCAEILHWCAFVGKPDLAESYTASNMTIEQIRNDLMSQTAQASFEIQTGRSTSSHVRQYDSVEHIYARRRETIATAMANRRAI